MGGSFWGCGDVPFKRVYSWPRPLAQSIGVRECSRLKGMGFSIVGIAPGMLWTKHLESCPVR